MPSKSGVKFRANCADLAPNGEVCRAMPVPGSYLRLVAFADNGEQQRWHLTRTISAESLKPLRCFSASRREACRAFSWVQCFAKCLTKSAMMRLTKRRSGCSSSSRPLSWPNSRIAEFARHRRLCKLLSMTNLSVDDAENCFLFNSAANSPNTCGNFGNCSLVGKNKLANALLTEVWRPKPPVSPRLPPFRSPLTSMSGFFRTGFSLSSIAAALSRSAPSSICVEIASEFDSTTSAALSLSNIAHFTIVMNLSKKIHPRSPAGMVLMRPNGYLSMWTTRPAPASFM
mmetsp:Transcript_92853/g.181959  ORF Transcript_92853/g.181959 Transcript_92853/m.181959 type:complete len:286 (-) Transcript_92853:360-1217(-)